MAYVPPNPNGSATSANSKPVVIASDQATVPVSLASVPSHAVTNAGTFATQATLAAETTKVIGVTRTADGAGNLLTSTTNALDVNIKSGNPTSITANAGTNLNTSALALDATLTGGSQQVQGNVAAAATDSGNPIKIGAKYNTTKPTYTDGQRGDVQIGTRGSLAVSMFASDASTAQSYMADNADTIASSATANKMAVVSRGSLYNGTTWDLARGDTTSGAWVNVKAALPAGSSVIGKVTTDQTTHGTTDLVAADATKVNGVAINVGTGAAGTGTQRVAVASDSSIVLATGANTIGALTANQSVNNTQVNGVAISTGNGVSGTGVQRVTIASDSTGQIVLATGTNSIGKVGSASSTTGGLTTHTLISAASTNATSVKASAGTVYSVQASNTGAAVAFLKLFNLAVAPTVGTSVAVKTLIIPAGGGIVLSTADIGLAFGTGIAYSITGVATTADTTAVALAQVVVNIDYA